MNCPVQGWQGYIGFGTQTVDLKTSANPTHFQEIQPDEGLQETESDKAVISGGIRGSQDLVSTRRGKRSVEGSSGSGNLYPDDFYQSKIWACLLGNNQTVAGSSIVGYTHEFLEPVNESETPQFGQTIEVLRGSEATLSVANQNLWKYLGCFISGLSLTMPENDLTSISPEWLGIKELYNETPNVAPTFSALSPFESWQTKIKIGATLGSATDINYVDATFTADPKLKLTVDGGSRYPACRVFGKPEYAISLNQLSTDMLSSGLYGDWKNENQLSMIIELTHDQLAGSGSGFYSVKIELPRVSIIGDTPNLSAIEDFPHAINFIALTDLVLGYKIKVTTVDSIDGVYAV